jgi:hypothetical protein
MKKRKSGTERAGVGRHGENNGVIMKISWQSKKKKKKKKIIEMTKTKNRMKANENRAW